MTTLYEILVKVIVAFEKSWLFRFFSILSLSLVFDKSKKLNTWSGVFLYTSTCVFDSLWKGLTISTRIPVASKMIERFMRILVVGG